MSARSLPALFLLFLPLPLGAQLAQVHVVDDAPGPGVEFTALHEALAAAAPGDVVLLRDGSYPSSAVLERSVVLLGEPGGVAKIEQGVQASFPELGSSIVLRDLVISKGVLETLFLYDVPGIVHVEGCTIGGGFVELGGKGVAAAGVASLHLVRTSITGDSPSGIDGGQGLAAIASKVHLWSSSVGAGWGQPAVVVGNAASLFASGSTIAGGSGEPGGSSTCDGGPGGPGLVVSQIAAPAEALLLDTTVRGGAGGAPAPGCAPGTSGPAAAVVPPAQLLSLAGVARTTELDALVVEGGTLEAELGGAPGDVALLFWSFDGAAHFFVPAWNGTPALAAPTVELGLGVLPASGTTTQALPIPVLGLGDQALVVHAQGVFVTPGGELRLGSPSVAVIAGATAIP